ncbi:hypothetical protein J1N35_017097 [Gossypium stocksii]|uniref:Uncharacterized protein n=1 Tax=Gossypium stocksii TaxID=47602 RepID=A0A9D3VNM1_9ROSI|nr:hypothetical protein J1N35_017097 [Gossypium stocksii]
MASGHSTGGPDFYAGIEGRSVASNQTTALYRTRIPGIFMDPASQIVNRAMPNLVGKRTLADFQKQQLHYNHPVCNALLYLRSVKPKTTYQHSSTISPMDFSSNLSLNIMAVLWTTTFTTAKAAAGHEPWVFKRSANEPNLDAGGPSSRPGEEDDESASRAEETTVGR